ncbi:MAG: hypothetical protein F9K29_03435 [Hyphomicrobiaceae bacterium]|nr:MAG: hypothetical protein F9K29_03435 [Hyphomicrobiaceae bacterium]
MTSVKGWDTQGVTGLGLLSDGRLKLEFTGTNGEKRNVFMPADIIPQLVASLIAFNDKMPPGKALEEGTHLLGIKHFAVGSSDSGGEFVLALTTGDNLQMRFLMGGETIELLAAGLASALKKHGRSIESQHPSGKKH